MKITYDAAKNDKNIEQRGLSFDKVAEIDPDTVRTFPDTRHDYGELRIRALGLLRGRLHVFVFTPREAGMRIISFRKANAREEKWYEKTVA